jgi:FkbM family methyltransferase
VAIGDYEPVELKILTTIASSSQIVLDIGANVGFYAVFLGSVISSSGHIHCFEPLPKAFRQLTSNVLLNALDAQISSHNVALSDVAGTAKLHVPNTSGTSATSLRELHPEEDNFEIDIDTETLDGWAAKFGVEGVDLIKIDVEGAERLVLQGGWSRISADRPFIFAELLRKWSAGFGYHPQQVVEELRELDYRCFAVGDRLRMINEIDESTVETNFLFATDAETHEHTLEELRGRGLLH